MNGARLGERDPTAAVAALGTGVRGVLPWSVPVSAGALGTGVATAATAVQVAVNAPGWGGLAAALPLVTALSTAGLAVACLAVGLSADRASVRVGLTAAGVFALLATVSDTAAFPAAVAVALGAASTLPAVSRPDSGEEVWEAVALVLPVVGVVASVAAATGLAPAGLRRLGTGSALLGAFAAPALCGARPTDWLFGLPAGVGVLVAGANAPYVTGAVLLVAGNVVGVSAWFVVLAAVGVTAGAVAGIRRHSPRAALGAPLLLVAGVPATVGSALSVTLGVALLSEVGR